MQRKYFFNQFLYKLKISLYFLLPALLLVSIHFNQPSESLLGKATSQLRTVRSLETKSLSAAALTALDPGLALTSMTSFGLVGDGQTDNWQALTAAIAAAGGQKVQYQLPVGVFRISSNLSFPENITLVFSEGNRLAVDAGVTLTLQGQVKAGYYQIFTGKGTIKGPFQNNFLTPSWYGAQGDGQTDDTLAIQAAMLENKEILFPNGTFLVEAQTTGYGDLTGGILIPSNVTIKMSPLTVIKAKPTASKFYNIFNIYEQENVTISGGTIQGERGAHQGKEGEWGHGISISGSRNVTLQNITAQDCWGDGFYISYDARGQTPSRDIRISGCYSNNNRRQGLSIVGCERVVVEDSSFTNTNGTPPQSGIDIEPNPGLEVRDVTITRCQFTGNKVFGLLIVGTNGKIDNIKIYNNTISDSKYGIWISHTRGKFVIENNNLSQCRVQFNVVH